jgi:pimeloyl-ACP methyl ester carboxylesterase
MGGFIRKLIGILLIITVIVISLVRFDDRPVETLVARWATPPSEFIDVRGQIVHLRDEGPRSDPVPIVLIHGTSASLHTWEGWVQALRTQRRVITFDLPGFGLTGPFAGSYADQGYRGDAYARFVVDLLDHLKLQRVVIGGNSLGGEVAWRTAVVAPQRVDRLILVDASGPRFVPEEVPPGFLLARVPVLNRLGEYLLPRPMVRASVESVYGDPSKVSEALVDRYFEITLRDGNRKALGERLRVLEDDLQPELIARVTQPTLILWGERDRLIPPATAEVFRQAIAGSQVVVLPGLGHVPQEEDPVASIVPVKAFLGLR